MPDDTEGDAMHLALATLHECDLLVSWNCRHNANSNQDRTFETGFPQIRDSADFSFPSPQSAETRICGKTQGKSGSTQRSGRDGNRD